VAESVKRYWLHFFSFFELSVQDRRELRAMALVPWLAEVERARV